MKAGVFFLFLPVAFIAQTNNDSIAKSKNIDEVVITGYQKIEKNKLTSAVSTIQMKDIEQKATASVDQMLQGKLAGVMVTPTSGTPGQIAPIRIRGTASLSGSVDPLWVLDGVPLEGNDAPKYNIGEDINLLKNYSIAGVNPEDIEDITVLKDASATAIYGARAANGVIVITTKKGKKGRMNINFSSNTFVSLRPDFSKLNLMNSNQKVDFELGMAAREDLDNYRGSNGAVMRILNQNNDLAAFRNGGYDAISDASKALIQQLRNTNTDWGKLLYRDAINHQHSLSLSGDTGNHNYYASLGYYKENSTVIGSGFERFNITLKNRFKVNDKFTVGVSFFGTQNNQENFLSDTGSFTTPTYYSRTANPYLGIRNADGSYIYDEDINYVERTNGTIVRVPYNFIEERNNTEYKMLSRSARFIFDAEYKILKGLEFRTQLGMLLDNNHTERYATNSTYFMRKAIANSLQSDGSYIIPNGDYLGTTDEKGFEYNWKNILQYTNTFGKHNVDVLIGNEIRGVKTDGTISQMYGYNPLTRTSVPLSIPSSEINNSKYIPVDNYYNKNRYASFYGTASYTFDRKYTIFGSLRYDGTNLFGADTKDKFLPIWAISGSWNIKRENFLADTDFISALKLRASYGLQGNIDRNTSKYFVGTYGTTRLLGSSETTLLADSYPNSNLRWEKTTNTNLGIDLGLFRNRLNLTFDVYKRVGTDIIGLKEMPQESGVDYATINWAGLTNKGFEFSISSLNIDKENFKWSTTFNIAANRSNIDAIMARNNQFSPSGLGYPVNAVFGFKTAGLDANGIPLFYDKSGAVVSAVELFKLENPYASWGLTDYVESKLSDVEARDLFSYLGDRDPKFFGGITNTFNYKNWDLNVVATFNIKQYVKGTPTYNFTAVDRGLNYNTDVIGALAGTGSLPYIIGPYTADNVAYTWFYPGNDYIQVYNNLDIWNKEVSFVRISSIRLGYTLPSDMLKSVGIKSFRLSLEGRNLFTFGTKINGYFDPETYGNLYASPIQKSVVFGFNVGF